MKLKTKLGIAAMIPLLNACATSTSDLHKVSMAEVVAFENQIITAKRSQLAPPPPEKLYTQPVNKTEPCKLPTSKEQLERKNSRSYWDGDCKDGYAYGLGRDIALSDTHHVEEITIYNGDGDSNGQPWRVIDYVQNRGAYGVRGQPSLRLLDTTNSSRTTAPTFPFATLQELRITRATCGTWTVHHSAQLKS